jgi:hypothetical protein
MRRFSCLHAVPVTLVALSLFVGASASAVTAAPLIAVSADPVPGYLSALCTVGGATYLIDDVQEGEAAPYSQLPDCPFEVEVGLEEGWVYPLCVDGDQYTFADDESGIDLEDFLVDVNESGFGHVAFIGYCPPREDPLAKVKARTPDSALLCSPTLVERGDHSLGSAWLALFKDYLAMKGGDTTTTIPAGSVPAKYGEGVGLTCDNLPGFTDTHRLVNSNGLSYPYTDEGAIYELWTAP